MNAQTAPTNGFTIRKGMMNDIPTLTSITIASKAHWGYDEEFMRKAIPFLAVDEGDIQNQHVYVLELNRETVGYYQLEPRTDEMMWLESLFISPAVIGKGGGRLLMDHAMNLARSYGVSKIQLESDPNAEPFYLRMGAVKIGDVESNVQHGRLIPLMEILLF